MNQVHVRNLRATVGSPAELAGLTALADPLRKTIRDGNAVEREAAQVQLNQLDAEHNLFAREKAQAELAGIAEQVKSLPPSEQINLGFEPVLHAVSYPRVSSTLGRDARRK